MTDLPYFKFFPTEWLLGEISEYELDVQGAFIRTCCHYWRKECDVDVFFMNKKIGEDYIKKLIMNDFIQLDKDNKIKIEFLDEQWYKRQEEYKFYSESGKRGAKIKKEKAKLKRGSRGAKAIKEDNIDKYQNDPTLRITPELKKLLDK